MLAAMWMTLKNIRLRKSQTQKVPLYKIPINC